MNSQPHSQLPTRPHAECTNVQFLHRKTAATPEIGAHSNWLQRCWQRMRQPGDHWFFLLYFAGLALLLLLVSLLKLGMGLL